MLRQVFGLFWPLFEFNDGGLYTFVDIVPTFEFEKKLKRTEKSTET